jgi:hypothetical protein
LMVGLTATRKMDFCYGVHKSFFVSGVELGAALGRVISNVD